MESLSQSDLRSLLSFAQECYAIRDFESFEGFVPRLLAAQQRLIPAAHVTYNEMLPEKSESHHWISTAELATPQMSRLWEQHMNEHPVLAHILRTGDCRVRRISDFWSGPQLHDSGLHHDFYRLCDIEDVLCIQIPCPAPWVIGVAWQEDRTFTDRERLIADLARPHISQAWHNAKLVSRLMRQSQALRNGIENLDAGVILCSAQGRVQFINAQARRHLAKYFCATRQTDRRLPEELLLWVRCQDLRLSHNDDAPPVRLPLIYQKEDKRLVIRLVSHSGANLILMEQQRTLPDTSAIGALGLTAREVEVLTWIARGKTNNEISTILRMHIGTAKKHVEHILVKLGVETRTAAAARALAGNQPESDS